ncbi:SusD family protein [Elizabethkingia miricola]|nr:SusD family protein [Elizabethkingia miricola]
MKYLNIKTGVLALSLALTSVSCSRDFTETVFNESEIASSWKSADQMHSFVLGALVDMRSQYYYGKDFSIYAEVRSDHMFSNGNSSYYNSVANYNMTSADAYATNTYKQIYKVITKANNIVNFDINTLDNAEASKTEATYYVGQAYALRAQGFFDLLRLYGQKYTGGNDGIVLPVKFDPLNKQGRSNIADVEEQIEADFDAALTKMESSKTLDRPTLNRYELSINAVKALAARYYLYKDNYAKVKSLVNDIVASNNYKVIEKDALVASWQASGSAMNSIFELAYGEAAQPGAASYAYIMNSGGYANTVVKPETMKTYAANDARLKLIENFKGNYFLNNKFPSLTGAVSIRIVRYEEVVLDGAEAELMLGNAAKALEYLNMILVNRGLDKATSITMEDIMAERSKELIGEGFRMWDLLRWGKEVPRPTGAKKDKELTAFPIPRVETDLSGTLVKGNPGYDNYK